MAEGLRIDDAALEISPSGLEALLNRQGAELRVTRLNLSLTPEGLQALLSGLAPEGEPAPTADVSEGRLQVSGERGGKRLSLDLQAGALRLEFTPEGLRLVSE